MMVIRIKCLMKRSQRNAIGGKWQNSNELKTNHISDIIKVDERRQLNSTKKRQLNMDNTTYQPSLIA